MNTNNLIVVIIDYYMYNINIVYIIMNHVYYYLHKMQFIVWILIALNVYFKYLHIF